MPSKNCFLYAMISLATKAAANKIALARPVRGMRARWTTPTRPQARWCATRPTKPMVPVNAIATPVVSKTRRSRPRPLSPPWAVGAARRLCRQSGRSRCRIRTLLPLWRREALGLWRGRTSARWRAPLGQRPQAKARRVTRARHAQTSRSRVAAVAAPRGVPLARSEETVPRAMPRSRLRSTRPGDTGDGVPFPLPPRPKSAR